MQSYPRPSDAAQSSLERQRQQLERLVSRRPSVLGQCLRTWGQALVRFLTAPAAPRIRPHAHQGQMGWQVYDPHTQRHHYFGTASEVHQWLEHRYRE